jgi:NAD(P)-dependent dehydrogenase (short-subunit alcohol dehydrogenase family)
MTERRTGSSERVDLPVAVVVGAGGMGMAVARRLGQRHRIVLASLSAGKRAARQEALRAEGHDAVAVQCDITDENSVAELARFVSGHGSFRTLAHVAALSPSMADWRTILRVDLVGPALVERALLPLATQGTAAVFVSSVGAYMTNPRPEVIAVLDEPLAPDIIEKLEATVREEHTSTLAYLLSKFALNRMCGRFAARWGQRGARIVSMSPGLIATPMGALEFENQPQKTGLLDRTPLSREGTMLETADAVEFLASDRASFITGTDLLVDGGIGAVLAYPE